jgi:3-hydroxyisobutyrate dehydrogenase-like beta-hydroxyacid dehydrogenase
MTERPAVGFIGVGNMGRHMAGHLLAAGYRLGVHDARREAAAPLVERGALWADSPAALATACDVVLTSLPGPPEFVAVATGESGVLTGLRDGGVLVDLTTNSPTTVRAVGEAARARGVTLLDAPVSGGVFGAESRRLTVMVGGDRDAFERVRPLLDAIGDRVVHCGGLGAGSATKLVNNMISLSLNMVVGEALTLGVKAGVDLATLAEVIQGSSGATWKLGENYPKFLFKGNFEPGFMLDLAAKDLRLGTMLAKELGLPLDFANLAEQRYIEAQARGWGRLHADAVVRLQEERAGVELRTARSEP